MLFCRRCFGRLIANGIWNVSNATRAKSRFTTDFSKWKKERFTAMRVGPFAKSRNLIIEVMAVLGVAADMMTDVTLHLQKLPYRKGKGDKIHH